MNELVIKRHDFEAAKQDLKEFVQKKEEELKIDTVRTDGGFLGVGAHKVTGNEFNDRLAVIQKHLIDQNTMNNQTIEVFNQIYRAFEALDKDYIDGILASIKATEETSKRIEVTQKQIKKIVEDQKKSLEILKKFKDKLDRYEHLDDIDKIWDKIERYDEKLDSLTRKSENALETAKSNKEAIYELNEYKKSISSIVHLNDVDEIWKLNENNSELIAEIQKQEEETKTSAQKSKEHIDAVISEMTDKNDNIVQALNKKIKYIYMIAGGSLSLALIELAVIFLKVI